MPTDAQKLALLAKQQGLSIAALARLTGMARDKMSLLIRGERNPRAVNFIAVGHLLGLRVLPQLGSAVDINVLPEVLAADAKRRGFTLGEIGSRAGVDKSTVHRLLHTGDGSWATCASVMDVLGWRLLWPKLSRKAARQKQKENEKY